ncbi:MAG: thiol:disulfide interchange protein DsbA/DsbL [Halieaceae bacterium]|jgi:thiol:disulfide interchange protein DsbA|nr:thiol:disulfide interchange protein DsbA/DsbL [Halieaceae bacterium]
MLRLLTLLALLVGGSFTGFAAAQDYEEGKDYELITPPLRTSSADKIEVVEFFAYSCGHCFNFEPMLKQWADQRGDDVAVNPSPAVWSPPMEPHAKAYYTAKALGVLDTMHDALFAAFHVDRKRLRDEAEIRAVFVENGVSAEDFTQTYRSFGVDSQVRQAVARAKGARISGTPEMMVAGKYRINARAAGGHANMLKIAEFLVEKERAADPG